MQAASSTRGTSSALVRAFGARAWRTCRVCWHIAGACGFASAVTTLPLPPRAKSYCGFCCHLTGFHDSIGLYKNVDFAMEKTARAWVHRFGLTDLVTPPAPGVRRVDRLTGKIVYDRPRVQTPVQYFHNLSFGEQKLVLLCRAMVKQPPLLLLDEPTHGLAGESRDRLLQMLSSLVDDPAVTIVYVSHHQDEIDALAFENVLQLDAGKKRD